MHFRYLRKPAVSTLKTQHSVNLLAAGHGGGEQAKERHRERLGRRVGGISDPTFSEAEGGAVCVDFGNWEDLRKRRLGAPEISQNMRPWRVCHCGEMGANQC